MSVAYIQCLFTERKPPHHSLINSNYSLRHKWTGWSFTYELLDVNNTIMFCPFQTCVDLRNVHPFGHVLLGPIKR